MKLTRNFLYWLLVAGNVLWIALVFLAAYGRQQGWDVAGVLYAFFDPVCHQKPERSFACFGNPLAACHRCLGLYVGFLVGLLAWPYLPRARARLLEHSRLVALFFVPMAVDVFLVPNTYLTRFATGLVASFPVALLAWVAAVQIAQSNAFETSRENYAG